jgi:5-methylcytosine-specific restriction endonuclease McrA
MVKSMNSKKQVRANFRSAVFTRDKHECCKCGWKPTTGDEGLDAHHITDRNEIPNGGYVPENGISLCTDLGENCHLKAEQYHIKGVTEPGYHPRELYELIGSSFEKAVEASKKS